MIEDFNIGGKNRVLKFNNGVTRKTFEAIKVKRHDELTSYIANVGQFFNYVSHMLFYALIAGAKHNNENFTETLETVKDWVDDLTQDEIMSLSIFNPDSEEKKAK